MADKSKWNRPKVCFLDKNSEKFAAFKLFIVASAQYDQYAEQCED